jgi:hypothetical protein
MIEVVCVKVGDKYADEYVINLFNGVKRHLTHSYRFSCITDSPIESIKGINWIPCPEYLKGWWAKLYLFSPDNGLKGTCLYLDLDQIIIGDLNKFIEFKQPNSLFMIHDFVRNFNPDFKGTNSSVMMWDTEEANGLYEVIDKRDLYEQSGDQGFIFFESKTPIHYWPYDWVKSWKWEVLKGGICGFYYNNAPIYRYKETNLKDTSILCFHGKPDPHEIEDLLPIWRGLENSSHPSLNRKEN